MRKLLAGGLLVVAAGMALVSYFALSNLWADYQDSPTGTYLAIGLPWLVLALGVAVVAVRMLRKP